MNNVIFKYPTADARNLAFLKVNPLFVYIFTIREGVTSRFFAPSPGGPGKNRGSRFQRVRKARRTFGTPMAVVRTSGRGLMMTEFWFIIALAQSIYIIFFGLPIGLNNLNLGWAVSNLPRPQGVPFSRDRLKNSPAPGNHPWDTSNCKRCILSN